MRFDSTCKLADATIRGSAVREDTPEDEGSAELDTWRGVLSVRARKGRHYPLSFTPFTSCLRTSAASRALLLPRCTARDGQRTQPRPVGSAPSWERGRPHRGPAKVTACSGVSSRG